MPSGTPETVASSAPVAPGAVLSGTEHSAGAGSCYAAIDVVECLQGDGQTAVLVHERPQHRQARAHLGTDAIK